VTALDRLRSRADNLAFIARVLRGTGVAGAMKLGGVAPFARVARSTRPGPHLAVMLHARMNPHKECLVDGDRRWTWRELDHDVNRLAHALAARGAAGAPVACMLGNRAEYVLAQQALARIGATAVQIGYRSTPAEIAYILDNAEPRAAIVGAAHADAFAAGQGLATTPTRARVIVAEDHGSAALAAGWDRWADALAGQPAEVPPAVAANDGGGVIVYTSGTTGKPKGATRNLDRKSVV